MYKYIYATKYLIGIGESSFSIRIVLKDSSHFSHFRYISQRAFQIDMIYIYWYKHTPMHTSTHIYTQMHPDIHEYHKLVCPKSYLSIFSLVSVPWTVALWNVSEGVSPINNIKSMKKSQRLHTLHNVTFLHLCLIAFRTLDT